jgi:hypothetical protein
MATLVELKAKAKKMGYKGYSRMKKAEIEKLLTTPPPKPKRLKSKAEQAKNPVRQVQLPKKGTPASPKPAPKPAPKKLETEPLVEAPPKKEEKRKSQMEEEEGKLKGKFEDLVFELKDKKGQPIAYVAKKALTKPEVIKSFVNYARRGGGSTSGFTQLLKTIAKIPTTSGRAKKFEQIASKMTRDSLLGFAIENKPRNGVAQIKRETGGGRKDRDDRTPEGYIGSQRQRLVQSFRFNK